MAAPELVLRFPGRTQVSVAYDGNDSGQFVFTRDDGESHLTSALDQEGDPMASVAGRLTATGIPAILAMTHSVLEATTTALFVRETLGNEAVPMQPVIAWLAESLQGLSHGCDRRSRGIYCSRSPLPERCLRRLVVFSLTPPS